MSQRLGRVIARDGHTSVVAFDTNCQTCSGCHEAKPKQLELPVDLHAGRTVVLDLTLKDQIYALFNSLLLPLLLAVLLAFIADWLLLSEAWGIFAAFCGFTLGMVLCRPLGPAALQVNEQVNDSVNRDV